MKNKSSRHKDLNTFKFQPFAERIANIDIDVFHRIGHEYETETEENECYFHQAVENWSILNLTEGYGDFKKEVKAHTIITLPQLLLHKEHVIETLLKHLKLKNPLSLQPLLNIVVALAKDLRTDFYEHYKAFLEVLIELLATKDTDQLEWVFTCLAYLFKFLWRPLLKDITLVFNTLLPLLSSSRPEYVNGFAAGSFAFVARKVKDRHTFLHHILKVVKSRKDGVEGCGKLFFEVMHGVSGQFHSCAEPNLTFLLAALAEPKFHQETLFEILEQIVGNIVVHIQPQNSALLWSSLLNALNQSKSAHETVLLLKLLGQSIEYKQGKVLTSPGSVVEAVNKMIGEETPEDVLLLLAQIAILLLQSQNVRLTQEQASMLTRKMLSLRNEAIFLYFIDNISGFSSFEPLILPQFLKYCLDANLNENCLHSLTKLVLKKAPLCQSGIKLADWKRYGIDFGSKDNNAKMEAVLVGNLDLNRFENNICALICLPHLKLSNRGVIIGKLVDNCKAIVPKLSESNEKQKDLFVVNVMVECLVHLKANDEILNNFDFIINNLVVYCKDISYLVALKTIDLILTLLRTEEKIINLPTLIGFNQTLEGNFSSPFREIRLLTAHLYTLFETLPLFARLKHSDDPEAKLEPFKVFSILFGAEAIESQVQTYRDQVVQLDRLDFDKPQMSMCVQTPFRLIPVRYLCGILYVNFKLLWQPVLKLIEAHAHGLEIAAFWEVYGEELKTAAVNVRRGDAGDWEVEEMGSKCGFLNDLCKEMQEVGAKPDFGNYRLLLWRAMAEFPAVAQAKTRDVSGLVLDFVETEYTRSNSDIALTWNIKQNSTQLDETIETSMDDEKPTEKANEASKSSGGKTNTKVLAQYLSVLSKMRSPKSMYREPELAKLYFDLLQHKNPDIQKLALDCIMTYKHKYLTPYKDHLYNLIDDKTFKNELTTFKIDKDSDLIQPDHRADLIPFIMRIVFSKMSVKTGMRTGGKASGQLRRSLILRFLAGCQENEMLTFIQMAFRFYNRYLDDNPEAMVNNVINSLSLDQFMPPKRLLSALNLLNVILDQFGGLMSNELLTFVLQIVFIVGATIKTAYTSLEQVHSGYYAILKVLRSMSILVIGRFFEQFELYPWTRQQINTVFSVFVWPYLDKLVPEGIHSPTSLLKLLVQWGSNPRYFALLNKHQSDNQNQYCLQHIIKLLLHDKSHVSVLNSIEEMIEKLLTLQPNEEDPTIVIDNTLPLPENILERVKVDEKLNFGSCILLPHVGSILERIKQRLGTKNKSLNQRQLFILSRISELVWEPEISEATLKLLLPVVHKRCSGIIEEEVVLQLLTTVGNLVGNVVDPRAHLRQISPLFGEVSYNSGRKRLIQILKTISASCDELAGIVDVIEGVNAFDSKWIDQPDFQRRHDTFKQIQTDIANESIGLETGALLIHTCFFLLKSEKDLSLKESSSYCLKQLVPHLIHKFGKESGYLLNETTLALIRNGMKSKNDDFRNEVVVLLGHLARECAEKHPVLRDLNAYTSKTDPEVDFFENITHLQLHRHARALLKFSQATKELKVAPTVRSLTQFVLPLASHYLCNEKFATKNSVIDAGVEVIGTVCRILPWHQYEGVLKYYLGKLRKSVEHQRQLVRIIVAILDAFHYDLSKASVELLPAEEIVPEIELQELDQDDDEEEPVLLGDQVTVLCKSTATRVTKTIQYVLLPQLHRTLAEMTHHEAAHKVNRKRASFEREEEDLLRVPISLALVKLLQRLPKPILDANLPGIFMKACTFLKSRGESVRRVTRETLQKIMLSLGAPYLGVLLGEMLPLLNRGYQVHVLVFTVHSILVALKASFQLGDVDKVVLSVLKLCQTDLFGVLAEERAVAKIAVKTGEAKTTKSYDTYQILGEFISEACLMDVVVPIKEVLEASQSFKVVRKAEECLRHLAHGLADNPFVGIEALMAFAYGTASESIPQLLGSGGAKGAGEKGGKVVREDCFIIPKAPVGRSGVRVRKVRLGARTNAHILVEFGLRMCYMMLKREKIKGDGCRAFLDPFVGVFKNCLKSKHIKLGTLTLQCLHWVLKYDLPAMEDAISGIVDDVFAILHKYAAAGLSKGDNFDLVVAAFKAMAVLVRDVKYYTIDTEQLKILLLYAEQDMHDYDRQATAFNLLKAIIARKLIIPEIHEVMSKVAELSITSELDYVRTQSRAVFHQYLMDYPLGDKLDKHLAFYVSQLSYEMQYGRESAIEMLNTLILTFPMKTLIEHSGTLFVTMGARLVNDEVPECRKRVAESLTQLLTRLDKPSHDALFDIVALWLKDNLLGHRRLAAQLCGIIINVEKTTFATRLPILMPLILNQFGLDGKKWLKDHSSDDFERLKDHHLFQVIQMLLKVCAQCAEFLKMAEVEDVARHVQTLLGHPHDWVRLGAAQFIGFVLASTDIEALAALLGANGARERGYLLKDPAGEVKALALDLCDQLQPGAIQPDLAEQVIKNLVFVARVLQKVPLTPADGDKRTSLLWLAKRMRKIVNAEVVEAPGSGVLRTEVFKWIAGVASVLELGSITPVLHHLLAPLVREMVTTEEANAPLRQLAKEVGGVVKKRVGMEAYTDALAGLQQSLAVKRAERKRTRNQLAVIDPEAYAKKKLKRHDKKKVAGKRKMAERKGKRDFKRRKTVDLDPVEEVV